MHEYDAALKLLLQRSSDSVLSQMTGIRVTNWINAELPQVQTTRADLLGYTADDRLVHVELQSTNHDRMALRMSEYALRIYGEYGQFPKQIVLYAGWAPMRMQDFWREPDSHDPDFTFRYTLIDMRDLDGDLLLYSPHIADNLLAILARLRDRTAAIRQILRRIASLRESERRLAFAQFLVISGLRRLAPTIKKEVRNMPILDDIMDHDVIGPAIRQGLQQGLEEGLKEGLKRRQEAGQKLVKRLLEKRFGITPDWVQGRLPNLTPDELDALALRVFDVARVEELFPDRT